MQPGLERGVIRGPPFSGGATDSHSGRRRHTVCTMGLCLALVLSGKVGWAHGDPALKDMDELAVTQ